MAYCYQNGNPLGFAVQLRLTPELKQALISARASGEPFSLRFRDEPHREAVLTVAGQEYFFSTAQQAGQVEVVEMHPGSKLASSVSSVKQRLTIQRPLDADTRPRGLGLGAPLAEDRRKRSAVLLDGNQRGGGVHPRVTTTTEILTRPAAPQQGSLVGGAPGLSGRFGGGVAALGGTGSSFRQTQGSAPAGPRAAGVNNRPGEMPKSMELPKPRSQQPGGCALVKQGAPTKTRITPTPPRQDSGGSGDGTVTGQLDVRPCSGGSGGGGGSSPVGYGSGGAPGAVAAAPGGGAAAAAATTAPPPPVELPRGAVLAARRGDLPLVVAALLREQPLTASSLQSRIDQAYRTAAAKLEAREYVKRVIDNCCSMSANRMNLRPDVLAREGPRLDELLSGTSPTTDAATERGRGTGAGKNGSMIVQGAMAKRMASCSPDRRTSPDTHQSPVLGPQGGGRSSTEDAAGTSVATGTVGGEDDDDGRSILQNGPARIALRQIPAASKRQRTSGPGSAGQPPPPPSQQRNGTGSGYGSGRGGGGGSSGALRGYDDFDDLADPVPVASAPPPRETSAGRPMSQQQAGRAAAAKAAAAAAAAAAAKPQKVVAAPGGPRGCPTHAQLANSMAGGSQASQPSRLPPAPPAPSKSKAALGSAVCADGGAAVSPSPLRRATEAPPAKPAPVVNGTAGTTRAVTRRDSEDDGGDGSGGVGSGSTGDGSESRMDTDGRGTTVAATATAVTASPDLESAMDMETQAYADLDLDLDLQEDDKDAEWYRSYVDWNPEPHAAVQSTEQYAQYEREYRHKFDVYSRLNQKYNEVVREADAHRAAVEAARGSEEQSRCIRALWRLGATKWKLLEVWKQARRNLHADLGDLRDKVAEYVARQATTVAAAVVHPPQPQMQMQPS
ncbi:hypothetical protein VaNZ11_005542 [Volvox africanus]|uniref:OCEL domain-containing protein n=1 Tax=Volvox africanus TaxID=51714 RepID=A0ABQ5S051_9CHLO|nr:hypothetical protein VaNZ11_005542 [Volvox africanus]